YHAGAIARSRAEVIEDADLAAPRRLQGSDGRGDIKHAVSVRGVRAKVAVRRIRDIQLSARDSSANPVQIEDEEIVKLPERRGGLTDDVIRDGSRVTSRAVPPTGSRRIHRDIRTVD